MEAIILKCPGCGAGLDKEVETCGYCQSPVIIKSFRTVKSMPLPQINKLISGYAAEGTGTPLVAFSLGLCQLRLKLYDKALKCFEQSMGQDAENADAYFYACVCLLKGTKAFLLSKDDAEKCVEYLNAANIIKPSALYYLFLSYIKLDFYKRKFFGVSPDWEEEFATAQEYELSAEDIEFLFDMLQTETPTQFA